MTAAALFAAASLTDLFDGRLARRWHVQSVFGTLADPFADKLLVLGSLVALAAVDRIPVWVVVIIAVARGLGHAAARVREAPAAS